jgi:hemerythrin superfamily protein
VNVIFSNILIVLFLRMKRHIRYANILQIVCHSTVSRDLEGLIQIAVKARVVYERRIVLPIETDSALGAKKTVANTRAQTRYRVILKLVKLFTANALRFAKERAIEHRLPLADHLLYYRHECIINDFCRYE